MLTDTYTFENDRIVEILSGNVKKQNAVYGDLVAQDDVKAFIEKKLKAEGIQDYNSKFTSLFFDVVEPNLTYNKSFTEKVLQNELNKISYTRGSVERGTLIISKGEVVEGDKFQKLKSLQSEYESQVWSEANYNWILFAYTLLVALALLMLLLFLRKYRIEVFENNTKVTFIFFNI